MIAAANVNELTGRNRFDYIEQVGYLKRFAIVVEAISPGELVLVHRRSRERTRLRFLGSSCGKDPA